MWGYLLGSVSALVRHSTLPHNTALLALALSAHVTISSKSPLMVHGPVVFGTFFSALVRNEYG